MKVDFFSIGFRPFFASGILFGAIALLAWADFWQLNASGPSLFALNPVGSLMFWHPHEMIMGFTLAIVMGFLLTAVRNWTGLETAPPISLFLVWLTWLVARAVMAFGGDLPYNLVVITQILPIILCAAFIANPILQKRMWRNLFAPIVLILFALMDVVSLNKVIEQKFYDQDLFQSAVLLIMFLITMIAGRIIPFFTANKLGIKKYTEPKTSLLFCVIPLLALIASHFVPNNLGVAGFQTGCAALLCVSHTHRLIQWHHVSLWQHPMLWSLWLSYGFLPIGFFIFMLNPFFELSSIALHVMTIGTLSCLVVSMVSRVSLGHTGRVIQHDSIILAVIVCMIIAMVVRTFAIMLVGASTSLIIASALIASLSLALLFMRFIYVWSTPRADSKP